MDGQCALSGGFCPTNPANGSLQVAVLSAQLSTVEQRQRSLGTLVCNTVASKRHGSPVSMSHLSFLGRSSFLSLGTEVEGRGARWCAE